jgi:hypothetical protein
MYHHFLLLDSFEHFVTLLSLLSKQREKSSVTLHSLPVRVKNSFSVHFSSYLYTASLPIDSFQESLLIIIIIIILTIFLFIYWAGMETSLLMLGPLTGLLR